jgi:replicative DNA helicase
LILDAPVELLQTLSEDDFTQPECRELFTAMKRVAAEGRPIDLVTLDADLSQHGTLETVGGPTYLVETSQFVPTAANVGAYINIVQDAAARRKAMQALRESAKRLYDPDAGLAEIVFGAREALGRISVGEGTTVSLADLVEHYILTMADKRDDGIPLGFPGIDGHLVMIPGEMTVIGARSGVGKTVVMQQVGINAAGKGKRVLWVSAEMAQGQIEERAVAHVSDVSSNNVKYRNIGPDELSRIGDALQKIRGWKMEYIFDARTISQIEKRVRHKLRNDAFDLVIVDYLQFIADSGGRGKTREQEVADASRRLKTIALDFKVPLLTAAQLGRGVDSTMGKARRPRLSDLRESSSIEQDADNVVFLFEVEEASVMNEQQKSLLREVKKSGRKLIDVSIAKNRQGESGLTYSFAFNGAMMRYEGLYRPVDMRETHGATPFDAD